MLHKEASQNTTRPMMVAYLFKVVLHAKCNSLSALLCQCSGHHPGLIKDPFVDQYLEVHLHQSTSHLNLLVHNFWIFKNII